MLPIIIQVSNINAGLQNRAFKHINGKPALCYLIGRLKKEYTDQIVLSVSDLKEDDVFVDLAKRENIKIFRGSWERCVQRLLGAMQLFDSSDFIRVYANNPLVDIEKMRVLEENHVNGNYAYSYNEFSHGLIMGTGCEIFNKSFVEKLVNMELLPSQEETIAYYIRQNEDKYHVYRFVSEMQRKCKVNLESEKDLAVINDIVANVSPITNENINAYIEKHPVLAKYNQEAPTKEVGLEKLYLHTKKTESLLKGGFDESYPISVELTFTNRCNLDCVYCSDKDLKDRQGESVELSKDVLSRLFEDLANGGTQGITIEGGGEPTIYKHFGEMVAYAKKCGLATGLITNGTVKLPEDVLKQFEWIRVSLDASTAQEYKDLKGVDMFEKVLSNISWYAQHCPTVGVGYVVTKNNISHIESLVLRLKELHASYIQLRPVVDCPDLTPKNIDLTYLRYFQSSNFGVIVDGMKENSEFGNHNLPCYANSVTSVISGDGSVYLCGRLNIYDWLSPIGNINKQNFHDIWLGEERRKQWMSVQDKSFCKKNCPQCRVSKFNEAIDRLRNIKSRHFI